MRSQTDRQRRTWRDLSPAEKQERLRELRSLQQLQVEVELRRLHHHLR